MANPRITVSWFAHLTVLSRSLILASVLAGALGASPARAQRGPILTVPP